MSLRVDIQFTLNTHEDVVRGAEVHRAAPRHASTLFLHDLSERIQVQVYRSQRFHGVRGASGRGDGA